MSSSIRLTISYGYDIHKLDLPKNTYDKVKNGELIEVVGQGFAIEGSLKKDFWIFGKGFLEVYCEDGFEVYSGELDDAILTVETIDL
jgi:hypothetical protein